MDGGVIVRTITSDGEQSMRIYPTWISVAAVAFVKIEAIVTLVIVTTG